MSSASMWLEIRNSFNRELTHLRHLRHPRHLLSDGWRARPIDKFGNIGIGYSFGDAGNFVGQRFAARRANDPLGQLTLRESVLVNGEAAQTSTLRWEDYTQTAIDPADDCTIWYTGDYLKKGGDRLLHQDRRVSTSGLPVTPSTESVGRIQQARIRLSAAGGGQARRRSGRTTGPDADCQLKLRTMLISSRAACECCPISR